MELAHIALWTTNLDIAAAFWRDHFNATVGDLYLSRRREGFSSRFVTLPGNICIELMTAPWIGPDAPIDRRGWAHIALSLGSVGAVDAAAARFAKVGLLISPPRWTGDGYYEAIIKSPDDLPIEIVQ
jgi:lactoylglutathione lyase